MVYLRDIILRKSKIISQYNNIETVAYYYFSDKYNLEQNTFDLTNEENYALNGYLYIDVDKSEIKKIIEKPANKGINAISNIFILSGLYLLSKE
jgi:CRISPR/Cas system-associated endonuclease/helicase Cas3